MKSFSYKIKDKNGIHARGAGAIVNEAKNYEANMTIKLGNKEADLKRIFAVLTLCAKYGDVVTIEIDGADEDIALEKMKNIFKENV